jgi:hypothetical protein
MHRLLTLIGAVVMLVSFAPGSARAETLDTATVQVTLTILPYAKVTLSTYTVKVTLPFDAPVATCDPPVVGGTIICNCPVTLFGNVTPPAGAPGIWGVTLKTAHIENPGEHVFADLFEIIVINSGAGGYFNDEVYDTAVSSDFATVGEEGVVVITAIPQ